MAKNISFFGTLTDAKATAILMYNLCKDYKENSDLREVDYIYAIESMESEKILHTNFTDGKYIYKVTRRNNYQRKCFVYNIIRAEI